MTEVQAIRAAALEAAARLWADPEHEATVGSVLEWAQEFADFIETGKRPS